MKKAVPNSMGITRQGEQDNSLIIAHILQKSREYVLAHPEVKLNPSQRAKMAVFSRLRAQGKPMAYLLKKKEFWGLSFYVDQRVLIPRPETEHLVETALEEFANLGSSPTLIDIGTGSGCVIISLAKTLLAKKYQGISYFGLDLSRSAFNVAKKNATAHKLDKKIKFISSDLLAGFIKKKKYFSPNNQYLITANLPYLSEKIYASAEKSVKDYEPKQALLSGQDGLDHYRKLFSQLKQWLEINPTLKFTLVIEISPEQKNLLSKEIKKFSNKFKFYFKKDLAQKWRLAVIKNH